MSTTAARSYAGTPVTGPPEEQTAIAAPGRFGDAHALTTELGGVLYLINLMTALELPECLEADWRLASQVGPWGLLELLARGLLAETEHGYGDDPLWAALARLDGRDPTQAPGRGFVAAPAYRIPTGWREQLESAPPACAWASADGRLRLWSDAGFVLAEIPCEADAALAQVRNAMEWAGIPATRPLRRAAFADAPLAPGRWSASAALDRLLALILPCLRLRLALALGLAPDDRAALGALLGLRARVYVSSSHLDLVAPIDEVSLPARWAGLDRDPGWLPAFGRVVLFHFE